MAAKRPRTSSSPSSLPKFDTSPSADPPHKALRIHPSEHDAVSSQSHQASASAGHPILCNLPPTCNRRPTPIANTNDLESHYAMHHAHVCEVKSCGCVFPEARLLELHQTECHDPIAALRKERNEKIFQCHIPAPSCGRNFSTPKARRLHLIQVHYYSKQYFFAVTNKGIGGLLKKWGDGASLIRKEWKPREQQGKGIHGEDDTSMEEGESDDDNQNEESTTGASQANDDEEPADLDATPRIRPKRILSPTSSQSFKGSDPHTARRHDPHQAHGDADIAGLTQSLNSLSLVPNSVRFGRGGKARGFASDSPHRGGTRGTGKGSRIMRPMDADAVQDTNMHENILPPPFRGRIPFRSRARGRGRGRSNLAVN